MYRCSYIQIHMVHANMHTHTVGEGKQEEKEVEKKQEREEERMEKREEGGEEKEKTRSPFH